MVNSSVGTPDPQHPPPHLTTLAVQKPRQVLSLLNHTYIIQSKTMLGVSPSGNWSFL